MSDPAALASHIVDSYETASYIVHALLDNNLISKDDALNATYLLTKLRYTDFVFDSTDVLVCTRTVSDALNNMRKEV